MWNDNRCDQCHDPVLIGKNPVKTAKILEHLASRYGEDGDLPASSSAAHAAL